MIYDKLEPTAPDVPPILDSQREESSNKSLQGLDKDRLPSSNFCFIAEIKGDVRDNEYNGDPPYQNQSYKTKTQNSRNKHVKKSKLLICGPVYFIWLSFYQLKHYLHFLLASSHIL